MAQTVDLDRTTAQSCQQEAVSRRERVFAFGIEIRIAILVDDAPGERAWRTYPEGRGIYRRGVLEDRRREAQRGRPRSRRERESDAPSIPTQILSGLEPRTMRTSASGPRQASEDRSTSTRSD